MAMRTTTIATLALVMAISATPTTASAQDQRLRVSLGSAMTAGAIDSEMALTASVGYRFLDRVSFEVEVTGTESPEVDHWFRIANADDSGAARFGNLMTRSAAILGQLPGAPITVGGPFGRPTVDGFRGETEGRTLIAMLGFRYELPTQGGRLRPYVNAGLGMARTDQEFSFSILPAVLRALGANTGAIREIEESRTGLAAGAGVGASVRVYKALSVDVDARYLRLDRSQNLGRFGGGVSYRF